MVTVIVVHALLVTAFGVGIWRSADRRSLRLLGVFMVGAGLVGFPNHTVFAMSSRWMEGGFNDTMHIVLSNVFSLFVFMAMVLSAVAYRGWFRFYSIATILVVIGFGGAAWWAIQGIEENRTPWAGGFERINACAYFAWIVVLALTIIRRSLSQSENEAQLTRLLPRGGRSLTIDHGWQEVAQTAIERHRRPTTTSPSNRLPGDGARRRPRPEAAGHSGRVN